VASRIGWRLVLISFVLGGALALNGCSRVSFVERVVLVNPTSYDLLVDVRGEDDSSWLELGIARRGSETAKENVIDMGASWVFRFRYAGEDLGESRVSGSRLRSDRWRYRIPEEVGKKLEDRGYPPSAG
jgi:hypothetical protein